MTEDDDWASHCDAIAYKAQEKRRRERKAMARADFEEDGLEEGWNDDCDEENDNSDD